MPSRISRASSAYRRACLSAISARLAGAVEPLARVLADRLQHPKPVALAVHLHERLVDERLQLVEDRLARVRADGLDVREACTRRRRRPCAGTGAAPRPSSSEWLQSIVARSVCCRSGRSRAPEVSTLERVVEPLEQRLRREEPQPGGGELERERQAVQAPADRRDGLGVLGASARTSLWSSSRARRRARSPDRRRATRSSRIGAVEARAGRAGTRARRRS